MNPAKMSLAEARACAERLAAIEASAAWAVVRRLSHLRQCLAPEGSLRLAGLRLGLHGLRVWRREGLRGVCRRVARRVLTRAPRRPPVSPPPAVSLDAVRGPDRAGPAPVPSPFKFRVAFVGSTAASEAQSMRYRAHNIIEALASVNLEGNFVAREDIAARFSFLLSHDLIVLVRLMDNEAVAKLVEAAGRAGIPVVYDIDDYLFELWVMPYVEAFRSQLLRDVRKAVDLLGRCLDRCAYFTGSTAYLADKAAAREKVSFILHNGLNAAQVELSRLARERRTAARPGGLVRIGYFSGTRTHQADFRVAYPALMALLREEPAARLVIVGDLDLDEFPGLAPFADQIERLPLLKWNELPAAIAAVDVNLIPLELTPFNEGKSNLKYFEAGLCMVPSIASPTGILRESITHGHNGLLAQTTEEWYSALKGLVCRPEQRERMGQNAYDHVLRNYAPAATAAEAVAAYRDIFRIRRAQRGIAMDALGIVVLLPEAGREEERRDAVRLADKLAAEGHGVTVVALAGEVLGSAEELTQSLAGSRAGLPYTAQLGGDVPCCDLLLVVDPQTAELARANAHRARFVCRAADIAPLLRDLARPLAG